MKIDKTINIHKIFFICSLIVFLIILLLIAGKGERLELFDVKTLKEKEFVPVNAQAPEFIHPDFSKYWKGEIGIMQPVGVKYDDVPLPEISSPPPPEPQLVFCFPKPWINISKFNQDFLNKHKYIPLNTPPLDITLLPEEQLTNIFYLPEPGDTRKPDMRNQKPSPWDKIILLDDTQIEGNIYHETPDIVKIRLPSGEEKVFGKTNVKIIIYAKTYHDIYLQDMLPKLSPQDIYQRYQLARWCLEKGMYPEAIEQLDRCIQIDKEFQQAYDLLGSIAEDLSDFEQAIRLYHNAYKVFKDPVYLYKTGEIYRRMKLYEMAIDYYRSAYKENPTYFQPQVAEVGLLFKLGDLEACSEKISELKEKGRIGGELLGLLYQYEGLIALFRGDIERSLSCFNSALRSHSDLPDCFNARGVIEVLQSNYQKACLDFLKAIEKNFYHADARSNLGLLYLLAGKIDIAEQLTIKAVECDPQNPYPLYLMAMIYMKQNKSPNEVKKYLQQAAELDKNDYFSKYLLGSFLLNQQDLITAENALKDVLSLEPDFLPAVYNYALVLYKTKQYQLCYQLLKAYEHIPDVNRYFLSFLALCEGGLPKQARSVCDKLSQKFGESYLLSLLAKGYWEYKFAEAPLKEKYEKLKSIFQRAADYYPNNEYASSVANKLRQLIILQCIKYGFDIPDSDIIEEWQKQIPINVDARIWINQKKCFFEGVHLHGEKGFVFLSRDFPTRGITGFEIDFYPDVTDKIEYGIIISIGVNQFLIFSNNKGIFSSAMSYASELKQVFENYSPLKTPEQPLLKNGFKIKGEFSLPKRERISIYVISDGKETKVLENIPAKLGASVTFAIFASSYKEGDAYRFSIDNVIFYYETQR